MRAALPIVLTLVCCALAMAQPAMAQPAPRPALHEVLTQWVRAYDKGRIELDGLAVAKGEVDPLYGRGWIPGGGKVDKTHRSALVTLLSRAAAGGDARAMEQVVRLASKGLVDGKATLRRPHYSVRHLAGLTLPKFVSTASTHRLMQTAAGDFSGWTRAPDDQRGARAAALLALGAMRRAVVRPALQRQVRDPDPLIRLAAADGLRHMEHPAALPVLAAALPDERDGRVAMACVQAIDRTLAASQEAVPTDELRRVLIAVIGALGRTDWRADLEIVGLLGKLRSAMAVEPLIGVLERFGAGGGRDGASRRLQVAAHETLRSLTGAFLPIDDPAQWRAFWEQERDRFVVAKPKEVEPTRTRAGFFGLPVRGSNVLFVIDTSGSMKTGFMPKGDYELSERDDGLTRLTIAKRELLQAVDNLPGDAKFNLVSFEGAVHPWRRGLVRASGSSRAGLRQHLRTLEPKGATNIFGALAAGLELRTLAYGERYGTPVDEIFLLSDGEPTHGELVEPAAILDVIRETNRFSRVRINTIYMGGGGDSDFMRRLAEQNGGRYVRL